MVSIRLVMNGGIINKTEKGVSTYKDEELKEQIQLAYSEWQMNQYMGANQNETAKEFIEKKLKEIYGNDNVNISEDSEIDIKIRNDIYKYFIDLSTGKVNSKKFNFIIKDENGENINCTAEYGMTWQEWIESDYYPNEIFDIYYIDEPNGWIILKGDCSIYSESVHVHVSEQINSELEYHLIDGGAEVNTPDGNHANRKDELPDLSDFF